MPDNIGRLFHPPYEMPEELFTGDEPERPTYERPVSAREYRDDALPVRPVLPTGMTCGSVTVPANVVTQILFSRDERLTAYVANTDPANPVFVGQSQAQATNGYRLAPGERIEITATCDLWGWSSSGVTVTYLDQYRTTQDAS